MNTRNGVVVPADGGIVTSAHSRREFFQIVAKLGVMAAVSGTAAAVLQSCQFPNQAGGGSDVSTISGVEANGVVTATIDSSSPLAAVGSAAMIETPNRRLLVARTAADTFHAFSSTCTHQGCVVSQYSNGTFTCPCHGAQYNTSGQVTRGPAQRNLTAYAATFSGTQLTITL